MIKLQDKDGRSYSSIHTIRGVLRPAFRMAVEDDLLRKNPFDFELIPYANTALAARYVSEFADPIIGAIAYKESAE